MTTPDHLGGACIHTPDEHTFMPDVWEHLVKTRGVRTVLDVGCGGGWAAQWFGQHGVRVLGIEGDPAALAGARSRGVHVVSHDYTAGPLVPTEVFDLAWCSEFVEHVEDAYVDNWMATMKKARLVCMTFATPGQGGHHHVNERPEEYWLERFAAAGFECDREETDRLRATDKGGPYGRKTLTLFKRKLTMEHFYEKLPGYFTFADFYTWVAGQVPDEAHCVEIGVFAGRSAAYLGVELINAGKPKARLDLVDWGFRNWEAGGGIEGVRTALKPLGSLIGAMHDGLSWEQAKHYEDHSLDFVFIDAGHEYENVRRDIDAWLPKVKRGGILAGHDYTVEIPGVIKAVNERFNHFVIWRGSQWTDGIYYPVWWLRP